MSGPWIDGSVPAMNEWEQQTVNGAERRKESSLCVQSSTTKYKDIMQMEGRGGPAESDTTTKTTSLHPTGASGSRSEVVTLWWYSYPKEYCPLNSKSCSHSLLLQTASPITPFSFLHFPSVWKALLGEFIAYITSEIYAGHWRVVQRGAFPFKYNLRGKFETLQASCRMFKFMTAKLEEDGID